MQEYIMELEKEVNLLKNLSHSNIVVSEGTFFSKSSKQVVKF